MYQLSCFWPSHSILKEILFIKMNEGKKQQYETKPMEQTPDKMKSQTKYDILSNTQNIARTRHY